MGPVRRPPLAQSAPVSRADVGRGIPPGRRLRTKRTGRLAVHLPPGRGAVAGRTRDRLRRTDQGPLDRVETTGPVQAHPVRIVQPFLPPLHRWRAGCPEGATHSRHDLGQPLLPDRDTGVLLPELDRRGGLPHRHDARRRPLLPRADPPGRQLHPRHQPRPVLPRHHLSRRGRLHPQARDLPRQRTRSCQDPPRLPRAGWNDSGHDRPPHRHGPGHRPPHHRAPPRLRYRPRTPPPRANQA